MSKTMLLNANWRFHLGDDSTADFMGYDDSAWRLVTLPHDWSVEHPFDLCNASGTGYLPGGTAWYRKHFTMTPITVLGVLGNRSGVRTAQLSLSHGFGDGKAESCELTVEAVSNLLLGASVDFYLAMNLDGIATLNDMAGGVTVTLEDDFSTLDSEMAQGATITLHGDQAEIYVRSRRNLEIGTNEARMARQEQYMAKLFAQLDTRLQSDQNFSGVLFDALSPYLTTSMSRGRLINTAWTVKDYIRSEPLEISGEHRVGSDGFMQFYADEASLYEAVLDLFYEEAK